MTAFDLVAAPGGRCHLHKVGTGKRSITWPHSVDQALYTKRFAALRKRGPLTRPGG